MIRRGGRSGGGGGSARGCVRLDKSSWIAVTQAAVPPRGQFTEPAMLGTCHMRNLPYDEPAILGTAILGTCHIRNLPCEEADRGRPYLGRGDATLGSYLPSRAEIAILGPGAAPWYPWEAREREARGGGRREARGGGRREAVGRACRPFDPS